VKSEDQSLYIPRLVVFFCGKCCNCELQNNVYRIIPHGAKKTYISHFHWDTLYKTGFCNNRFLLQICNLFCRFYKYSLRDLQLCIICHIWTSNMGFKGEWVQIAPPSPAYPGFQVPRPSRDRVMIKCHR
jgi:hypothetical protein